MLQLGKANYLETETRLLDLDLSIRKSIVLSKMYDKQDDLNFEIFNFPVCDGDIRRIPSYDLYISHLIRFAIVYS